MSRTLVVFIMSLFVYTSVQAAPQAVSVMEKGQVTLSQSFDFATLSENLMSLENFNHIYREETSDMGFNLCSSWSDFSVISSDHIDLCTSTTRMAIRVNIVSRFTASSQESAAGKCVSYKVKFMPGTQSILLDNVDGLMTEFCLEPNGKTLSYTSTIINGRNKGLMYNLIYGEIKKMIAPLLRTVKRLAVY
jgi:hypothetical protein